VSKSQFHVRNVTWGSVAVLVSCPWGRNLERGRAYLVDTATVMDLTKPRSVSPIDDIFQPFG